MKKTLLLLAWMVGVASCTLAQTQKGRWLIEAQVGDFSYQKNSYSRYFSGSLTPSAGYFIANNLLTGLGLPLSLTNNRFDYTNSSNERVLGIGLAPFARYYLGAAKLKPYLGIAYSYNYLSRHYQLSGTPGSSKQRTSTLSPTFGVSYFMTQNVALSAGLTYDIQHLTAEGTSTVPNTMPFNYSTNAKSLGLSIGFQLIFF
jgi:outer membrane protein W